MERVSVCGSLFIQPPAMRADFEGSTMGPASAFSAEASAFPDSASFKSNSSWAKSSFSLFVPKMRRIDFLFEQLDLLTKFPTVAGRLIRHSMIDLPLPGAIELVS
jgi:hypothetical protein